MFLLTALDNDQFSDLSSPYMGEWPANRQARTHFHEYLRLKFKRYQVDFLSLICIAEGNAISNSLFDLDGNLKI